MDKPVDPTQARENELDALIAEYLRRIDRGENVDPERFIAPYPEVAESFRQYLRDAALLDGLGAREGPPGVDASASRDTADSVAAEETIPPTYVSGVQKQAAQARQFGRYRLVKLLGQGAMGAVYLAEDPELQRHVALKIPKFSEDETAGAIKRFHREARAAATLDHPNICRVHDIGEQDGTPFMTMAYVQGQPLSEYAGAKRRWPERDVAKLVYKIALALAEAHAKGVVHRDLKPGNVMLDQRREPIVMDFGLAGRVNRPGEEKLTQAGALLGTPAYMSPEQAGGELDRVGPHSDIFSLGVILYEMLTGQVPFRGPIAGVIVQIVRDQPRPPSELRPAVDKRIEAICLKMMAKAPEDRYRTAADVAAALRKFLEETTTGGKSFPHAAAETARKSENRKQEIVRLLQGGRFSPAIDALEKLARAEGPGAGQSAAWARGELARVRSLPQDLLQKGPAIVETAIELIASQQYAEVVRLLEAVPDGYRSTEAAKLLDKATKLQQEADKLNAHMHQAVRTQQYDGLQDDLSRLLEIQPGNLTARALYDKLGTYAPGRPYRFGKDGKLLSAHRTPLWVLLGSTLRQALRGYAQRQKYGRAPAGTRVSTPTEPAPPGPRLPILPVAIAAVAFALILLTIVVLLRDGRQTVRVEIDDELLADTSITLVIDGREMEIAGLGETIKLKPGEHGYELHRGNEVIVACQFTVLKGDNPALRISVEEEIAAAVQGRPTTPAARLGQAPPDRSGAANASSDAARRVGNDYDHLLTGRWIRVLNSPESVRGKEGARFVDGAAELDKTTIHFSEFAAADIIIRAKVRKISGQNLVLILRASDRGSYGAWDSGRSAHNGIGTWVKGRWHDLKTFDAERQRGFHEYAFSAVGDTLTAYVDGEQCIQLRDPTLTSGAPGISVLGGKSLFKDVEIQVLEKGSAGQPISAAAGQAPPMALAPFDASEAKRHQQAWAEYLGVPVETINSTGMKLALIPPGEFMMGTPEGIGDRDEHPQHKVRITKPFHLGIHEVTVGQFRSFVEASGYKTDAEKDGNGGWIRTPRAGQALKPECNWRNPGFPQSDDHPVVQVSWNDATEFCRWLSEQEDARYRLATEAEWEYACRAGTMTRCWSGNAIDDLRGVANIADQAFKKYEETSRTAPWDDGYTFAAPVGSFRANPFGLYDMHGNVIEWCADMANVGFYATSPLEDPMCTQPGSQPARRRLRQGFFATPPERASSAGKGSGAPDFRIFTVGFRVARTIDGAPDDGLSAAPSVGRSEGVRPGTEVSNAAGDKLGFIAFDPLLPHVFKTGERLTVRFTYTRKSAEQCGLFVRPLTNGKRTSDCRSHTSLRYLSGTGESRGWFTLMQPGRIDQVRIVMLAPDGEDHRSTLELLVDADAEWKASDSEKDPSPASHSTPPVSFGPYRRPELPDLPQQPLRITTHGLEGIPPFLVSDLPLPRGSRQGFFARIRGGALRSWPPSAQPALTIKEFAVDVDLELVSRDPDNMFFIDIRTTDLDADWLRVKVYWSKKHTKVMRGLMHFRGSTYWFAPECETDYGEQLKMTLLVGADRQMLFVEGEEKPLVQRIPMGEFRFGIQSYPKTDATIHRFVVRSLTDEERARLAAD